MDYCQPRIPNHFVLDITLAEFQNNEESISVVGASSTSFNGANRLLSSVTCSLPFYMFAKITELGSNLAKNI